MHSRERYARSAMRSLVTPARRPRARDLAPAEGHFLWARFTCSYASRAALRVSRRSTIGSGGSSDEVRGRPLPHVVPVGVELLRLQLGVEDPEVRRRIGARAGDPLPVERVVRGIRVDQRVPEPLLAAPPVDEQVLDEEGCRHHPHAVVHVAGLPELAHAGVDERDAGATALPRLQLRRLQARPRERVELGPEVLRRQVGEVEQRVPRELAPPELRQEPPAAARLDGLVPHRERAHLAPPQPRRQERRRPGGRLVPRAVVVAEVVPQELAQAAAGRRLAGLPRLADAPGPVGVASAGGPVLERVGGERMPRPRDLARLGQRRARRGEREARPPERREDREVRSGAGLHRPRLEEQRAGERGDLDPVVAQRPLQRGVDLPLGSAVAPVPEHGAGRGIRHRLADHPRGRSASQHQGAAALAPGARPSDASE